jgi:predicted metalloprotease with PDZ domain
MRTRSWVKNQFLFLLLLQIGNCVSAQSTLFFTVSIKDPAAHLYHVVFRCEGLKPNDTLFKMAEWTPGYYQFLHYADQVADFHAKDSKGKSLYWERSGSNGWKVRTLGNTTVELSYDVKATRAFVATNYLDAERGYISPAGLFLHPSNLLYNPVMIRIVPMENWNTVATGLDDVPGQPYTFRAADYDVLYDSPFLMGQLETLPSFNVKGIPHHFIAYKPGNFDKAGFMNDLQRIVTAAADIIGDIPYSHYSFLSIGPGAGGIEHLNSASVSFEGSRMTTKEAKTRIYHFLTHEYFHHYNVKRIRPVELGPFDYDKGSRTRMLWLSEGISVYYEYLIVKRAGFTDANELLNIFSNSIKEYENKPGRNFQTPAEASYTTWEDGPFGRTGEEVNKTISPYDKGPALGMLLDFKIRHETKNRQSLDALMRVLYNKYYKQQNRGFTEDEFRSEAEKMADTKLDDFFDYIYTLKTVDYPTYLGYAGLTIDTVTHEVPGAWLGINTRTRNDSLLVNAVEWQSPAWNSGMRARAIITQINGAPATEKGLQEILAKTATGEKIRLAYLYNGTSKEVEIITGIKKEKLCRIQPMAKQNALQAAIYKGWLGE